MRAYFVTIEYQHKGNRYPRDHQERVKASSAARAASLALRSMKNAKVLRGFREVEGARISFHVTVGGRLEPLERKE